MSDMEIVLFQASSVNRRLRSCFGDRVGYSSRKIGISETWVVTDGILPAREIPMQGKDSADKLLKELLRIEKALNSSKAAREAVFLGLALSDEAQAYVNGLYGTGLAERVRTFGPPFEMVSKGSGWNCRHTTRQEVVFVSLPSIEIFRYFPNDETLYKTPIHHAAALNWNHGMYHYIEIDKMSPSRAQEKLTDLQRRLVNKIADSMYPSAQDKKEAKEAKRDAYLKKSQGVLDELIVILKRWKG